MNATPLTTAPQLSPGMTECHARLMVVAKHGTPEAFSSTLASVLLRAELSISSAYDAGVKARREEGVASPDATAEAVKAFREYLAVHPSINLGGHEADTVARELALIALDFQAPPPPVGEPQGVSDGTFEELWTLFSQHMAHFNANRDTTETRAKIDKVFAASRPVAEGVTASPEVQAVVAAAQEWSAERSVKDWAEADLMKAVATLDGDWPGCEECDHECDEPCMPATVAEMHRSIDTQIAQLVHEGKLSAHEGYAPPEGFKPYPPPEGFKPYPPRRRTIPIAVATPPSAALTPPTDWGSATGHPVIESEIASTPVVAAPQAAVDAEWLKFDIENPPAEGLYWVRSEAPEVDVDVDDYGQTVGRYTGDSEYSIALVVFHGVVDSRPDFEVLDKWNSGDLSSEGWVTHYQPAGKPAFPTTKAEGAS